MFSGEEAGVAAALEQQNIHDYEFVSIDVIDGENKTVRCVVNYNLFGTDYTLESRFIDLPGPNDIYYQLSTPPENFDEAQPLWEEALKTLTIE